MVSVSIEKDGDDEEVFLNFLCDVLLEGTKGREALQFESDSVDSFGM